MLTQQHYPTALPAVHCAAAQVRVKQLLNGCLHCQSMQCRYNKTDRGCVTALCPVETPMLFPGCCSACVSRLLQLNFSSSAAAVPTAAAAAADKKQQQQQPPKQQQQQKQQAAAAAEAAAAAQAAAAEKALDALKGQYQRSRLQDHYQHHLARELMLKLDLDNVQQLPRVKSVDLSINAKDTHGRRYVSRVQAARASSGPLHSLCVCAYASFTCCLCLLYLMLSANTNAVFGEGHSSSCTTVRPIAVGHICLTDCACHQTVGNSCLLRSCASFCCPSASALLLRCKRGNRHATGKFAHRSWRVTCQMEQGLSTQMETSDLVLLCAAMCVSRLTSGTL